MKLNNSEINFFCITKQPINPIFLFPFFLFNDGHSSKHPYLPESTHWESLTERIHMAKWTLQQPKHSSLGADGTDSNR